MDTAELRSRASLIIVCLGVGLAFTAGGADAASGKPLILGRANSANATTTLSDTRSGPALKLSTASSSTPALAVSNTAKIARLNADQLDGLNSTDFQRATSAALLLTPSASPTPHPLLAVPALGTLSATCSTTDAGLSFTKYSSVAEADISVDRLIDPAGGGSADAVASLATFAATGSEVTFAPVAGVGSKGRYSIQLVSSNGGRVHTATVTLTSQDDNIGTGHCLAWAQLD